MILRRITILQDRLLNSILVKKKENLLYLTGRSFMSGYLLVNPSRHPVAPRHPSSGRRGEAVFFGDGLEKPPGIHSNILKNIGMYLGRRHILQLEDQFTFAEYDYIKRKAQSEKRKVKLRHVRSPVDYQRQTKDEGEIALIKKSMQIAGRVFEHVKKQLKNKSWTERKLAEFIKHTGFKLGAEDVAFPPIVASGVNAAIPHHIPSSKRLKAGESVIIDFGFKYKNYCSDFTRTVFLKKVHPRLEKVYSQVEKAYLESTRFIDLSLRGAQATKQSKTGDRLLRFARNDRGVTGNDVYRCAVGILAEAKFDKYFIHSLGHGTGLEIHELPNLSPNSKDILQDGMVFSIEPGIYIPNLGGVRIEDLVYLEGNRVNKFINISTKIINNII